MGLGNLDAVTAQFLTNGSLLLIVFWHLYFLCCNYLDGEPILFTTKGTKITKKGNIEDDITPHFHGSPFVFFVLFVVRA